MLHSPETSSSPENLLWCAGKNLSLQLFILPGSPWPRRSSRSHLIPSLPGEGWACTRTEEQQQSLCSILGITRQRELAKVTWLWREKSLIVFNKFPFIFKEHHFESPSEQLFSAAWHQKGAFMRKSTTRDDQNAFLQGYNRNQCFIPCPGRGWAVLSVPGSAAPRISAPASGCQLHSPSSWLELPAMRLHQESSLRIFFFSTQYDFKGYPRRSWS